MTSTILDLPDDPADLPAWLEARLFDPALPHLAAELTALHGPPAAPLTLPELLGPDADRTLERGLSALPRPRLRLLLLHPDLLAELRDLALTAGGDYWNAAAATLAEQAAAQRLTAHIRHLTHADEKSRPGIGSRVRQNAGTPHSGECGYGSLPPAPAPPRWRSHALTAFATAAAVLLAVYLLDARRPTPTPTGWGFAKLHDLPRTGSDAALFARLADLADEWPKQRPSTPAALAQRLTEFRLGCAALQLADDLPQPQWLRARCADWSAELDAHLRRLEATRDVLAVRTAADATAARIARELRARG